MKLEYILLSKISQSQTDKYCKIPLTSGILSSQTHRSRAQNGGYKGLYGEGNGNCLVNIEVQSRKMKNF